MSFGDFLKVATGNTPCAYQRRLAGGDEARSENVAAPAQGRECESFIGEHDVARRDVQQEDSEFFKRIQNLFDPRPAAFELLVLLRLPIRPDFRRELRPRIQIGPGEVEDEWPVYYRHLE